MYGILSNIQIKNYFRSNVIYMDIRRYSTKVIVDSYWTIHVHKLNNSTRFYLQITLQSILKQHEIKEKLQITYNFRFRSIYKEIRSRTQL